MSKHIHTPGPWHVIERANGQAFSIGCRVQTKGNLLTTHYIANIADGPTPQAKADARLIAAAPDMYDALKKIADWPFPFLSGAGIDEARELARSIIKQ